MYQRDYLMRQIEQAARVLAAIMKQALGGQPDQALPMFDQAYQPLLGVSRRVVSTLTDEQLISLLTSGSVPDLRRVASVLRVVKGEADVHELAGNQQAAAARYRRALALAGYLAGRSEDLLDGKLAAEVVERTDGMALTTGQRLALARVLESLGRYADAEDALFALIDDLPAETRLVDTGIEYYQRLLALTDADLEAGGLPRDEVNGSLAELLRRQVPAEDPDAPPGDDLEAWWEDQPS
jgi:tetratricopeptide (TPR) repeat protein